MGSAYIIRSKNVEKWQIIANKNQTVRNFLKRKLSQKGNKLKKSEKNNLKYWKITFLEIDPIKIAFLGNNPDQNIFICWKIRKKSEKILGALEIAKNSNF